MHYLKTIQITSRLLMAYLQAESQYIPEMKHFKNSTMEEPRQLDGSSCGVFVCMVSY